MALTFLVPPGIGDFSAMYQKLCCIDREIIIQPSADVPERIGPYLDILPKIKNGGYSGHGTGLSVHQTLAPGTDLASLADGRYLLSINTFLEQGGKVADWIPGPVDYHYETLFPDDFKRPLNHFLNHIPKRPLVGVYCSAYGNSRHWGFWGPNEWREFLEEVRKVVLPETAYVFIGAEYDIQISDVLYGWMQAAGIPSYYMVGAFHISATIELIRRLDYFFSFPSGLGFLADVVRTPNLMWFPEGLDLMRGTFCDPEQFESGQSMHRLFSEPRRAVEEWKQTGLKFMEERRNAHNTYRSVR